MKHEIIITPLNCSYNQELNNILTMEEEEYFNVTGRRIFCKNPDISWFKMRGTQTQQPYLEPVFYGLKKGDKITIETDALLLSGNINLECRILKVDEDYRDSIEQRHTNPEGALTSFYKRFKFTSILEHEGIGTIVNLRPTAGDGEIIIKNVKVSVETSNAMFSMADNVVRYNSKTDFMKCIELFSGTNLNDTYHSLLELYNEGKVSFPDDNTIKFTEAGLTKFKGLMAMFNGRKYRTPFVVYAEYVSPTIVIATVKRVNESGSIGQDGNRTFPSSQTMRKGIIYFTGGLDPARKTFIDLGMVTTGEDLTLKNVRFSMPQFDDSVKRPPNQIDELYTNLGSKLR